jgi:hypothetical protein
MKILLAGILGSIAMFIWTAIAHMALPLGEAGIRQLPDETAVISAMGKTLADQRGLYLFPTPDVAPKATQQEKKEAMERMKKKIVEGPSGILMYHPKREFAFGKWLTVEYLTELIEAILVVALLAQTRLTTFAGRVIFVTTAGILAAIATNVSYWNWYGFPKRYTAAYMFTEIVGFFLVGLVVAFLWRKKTYA